MRVALVILLTAVAAAGAAVAVTGPDGDETTGPRLAAGPQRQDGAPATCRHQSSAEFSKSARNLVVGPLVLVGGREYSPPQVISRFGGQKYPAVVLSGHRVMVELPRRVQRSTSLFYADDNWELPEGERTVADGHRVVDFRACATGHGTSSYQGREATFWSGFVLTTVPRCVRLRLWVDSERTPRRARISLGKRCA